MRTITNRPCRTLTARWLPAGLTLILIATVSMAAGPTREDAFRQALRVAGQYHRDLSNLPALHFSQPETATYEFERLTIGALESQHAVSVAPCFARWWAYELMGLELTALSLELRRTHDGYHETADNLERLGARMWATAMALLPRTASACGLEPRSSIRRDLTAPGETR
jgi:hypothetical protein